MQLEGAFFFIIFIPIVGICIVIMLCIYCYWSTKANKQCIVRGRLIRAGEALTDASLAMQRCRRKKVWCDTQEEHTFKNWLVSRGKMLEEYGRRLQHSETADDVQSSNDNNNNITGGSDDMPFPFIVNDDETNRKVAEMVQIANKELKYACSAHDHELDEDIKKIKDDVTWLEGNIERMWHTPNDGINKKFIKLCQKVPSLFLSLYNIIFRSIERVNVNLHEHGHAIGSTEQAVTTRKFLFGGFKNPRCPWMVHIYYITMLLIVTIWFVIMFISAIFDKTTAYSDINGKSTCSDVSKAVTNPPDCEDPEIHDTPAFHSFTNLNLAKAFSLAYGLTRLIMFGIHFSFKLTIWCVRKFSPCVALSVNLVAITIYIIIISYSIMAYLNDDLPFSEEVNIFYAGGVMRYAMIGWGFITLLLLLLVSPYYWLINKYDRHYLPTFTHQRDE